MNNLGKRNIRLPINISKLSFDKQNPSTHNHSAKVIHFPRSPLATEETGLGEFMICVDKGCSAGFSGRVYNIHKRDAYKFNGIVKMVVFMDDFMNDYSYPEKTHDIRMFSQVGKEKAVNNDNSFTNYISQNEFNLLRGSLRTFKVCIDSRENTTWQGNVFCFERGRNNRFNSIIEMFEFIMDCFSKDSE